MPGFVCFMNLSDTPPNREGSMFFHGPEKNFKHQEKAYNLFRIALNISLRAKYVLARPVLTITDPVTDPKVPPENHHDRKKGHLTSLSTPQKYSGKSRCG